MPFPLPLRSMTIPVTGLHKICYIHILKRSIHCREVANLSFQRAPRRFCSRHERNPLQTSSLFCSFNKAPRSSVPTVIPAIPLSSSCKRMSEEFTRFVGPKAEQKFQQKDGVPPSYTLIYRSTFHNYLVSSQIAITLVLFTCIFSSLSYLMIHMVPESEEEKRQRKQKIKELHEQRRREEMDNPISKLAREEGVKTLRDFLPSKPEPEDFDVEENPQVIMVLIICLVSIVGALFKLMRQIPVRIYINNRKSHCISIHYGHILPGMRTHHEFVAGTVRKLPTKLRLAADALYKDGSGHYLIMLDHYFRYPSDLDTLLGQEAGIVDDDE